MTDYDRKIHEDLHDITHLISQAKEWSDRRDKASTELKGWLKRVDKKLEEVMLRETHAKREHDRNNH